MKPYLGHLRPWGCLAYPYIFLEQRKKLEPVTKRAIFIGFLPTSKQYQLYDPENQQVLVTTAPVFRENSRLQYN
jgi:hypothetical protein